MRCFLTMAVAAALLLVGCTAAQIDRAEAISIQADARLAQANEALDRANEALAKASAASANNPEAAQIVEQAKAALDLAVSARDVAKVAADGSHQAVAAAKAAQAAGGSTIDILIAAVGAFVPTAGVALTAIRSAIANGQRFRQTVSGIEKAKESLSREQVDTLHRALSASQDEHVKAAVKRLKITI